MEKWSVDRKRGRLEGERDRDRGVWESENDTLYGTNFKTQNGNLCGMEVVASKPAQSSTAS